MKPTGLTYDTGVLIAAERGDKLVWSTHSAAIKKGIIPTVPAGVLAEAWRGGPQANLSRLIRGCWIESLTEVQARAVGALAKRSGHDDTVDLAVVEGALRRNDAVLTSNRGHIEMAAGANGRGLRVIDV